MNDDLTIIKKYYGEQMMHLCRSLFPTILDTPGKLSELLLDNFAPSKFLYDDVSGYQIDNFKNYIYNLFKEEKEEYVEANKTPEELLNELGYDFYECKTEDDIQRFKKYYKSGEELCTFNGGRLNKCYVFFAVKKNVDEIKREDFSNPKREDIYGTSVISIQFSKGNVNTLSIKNRYNHTVDNPDATFSNNLENIIPGLTKSFEKIYNFNINQNKKDFKLHNYVKTNDGKWYKYNYEINNIYYCPDNTIIDNFEVLKYDPDTYLVVDYFILDLKNKKIYLYDIKVADSFVDGLANIKKINIKKENDTKKIEITNENNNKIIIEIDKYNKIISYHNEEIVTVKNNFLFSNDTLRTLSLPNLEEVGDKFLYDNTGIEKISFPKLSKIGNDFIKWNMNINNVYLPNLKYCGDSFLVNNDLLTILSLPNLEETGDSFLETNTILEKLDVDNLQKVKESFLMDNIWLKELNIKNLKYCGDSFLFNNEFLKTLSLPNLEVTGDNFLWSNIKLEKIDMPNLKQTGNEFLYSNFNLKTIVLPCLVKAGKKFMYSNRDIEETYLDNLEEVGSEFLSNSNKLKSYYLPKLSKIGFCFLDKNKLFRKMILQSVRFNYENENSERLVRTR